MVRRQLFGNDANTIIIDILFFLHAIYYNTGTRLNEVEKRSHTFTATSTETPRTEANVTNYLLVVLKNEANLRPGELAITHFVLSMILSGLNFK